MLKTAPIVLFVYNRPLHTQQVIEALAANNLAKNSDLHIFSDGPKQNVGDKEAVEKVRLYIRSIPFFRKVYLVERPENLGLSKNVIDGINSIFRDFDQAIILEDDTLPSANFLNFMNEALEMYKNEFEIGTVQGFQFPIEFPTHMRSFFDYAVGCWGWGTWKNRWDNFEENAGKLLEQIELQELRDDFNIRNSYPFTEMLKMQMEGKINSWAIRWYASLFLQKKLNYYPSISLIRNIGNDGSGTHIDASNYSGDTFLDSFPAERIQIIQNQQALELIVKYRMKLKRANQKKNLLRKIRLNVLGLSK